MTQGLVLLMALTCSMTQMFTFQRTNRDFERKTLNEKGFCRCFAICTNSTKKNVTKRLWKTVTDSVRMVCPPQVWNDLTLVLVFAKKIFCFSAKLFQFSVKYKGCLWVFNQDKPLLLLGGSQDKGPFLLAIIHLLFNYNILQYDTIWLLR